MGAIIRIRDLVKRYGTTTAVDGISLDIEEGTLFAFLGPNGAGKSTTINCTCTLLALDGGTIEVDGHLVGKDDNAVRHSIGVVFQDSVLDTILTVRENLEIRGALYGIRGRRFASRLAEVAGTTGIEEILDKRYGKLSGGQRRRADIARGLIHTPRVLFLDEPTTGLDPQTRARVWETVRALQRTSGTTVFLTTHYMEEANHADFVSIIDHGRIVAADTPSRLRMHHSRDVLRLVPSDPVGLRAWLASQGVDFREKNEVFSVLVGSSLAALPLLRDVERFLSGFEMVQGSMDDVFMAITGRGIREDKEEET